MSARPCLAALLGAALLLGACQRKNDAAFEMIAPPEAPAVLPKHWTLPEFALTERSGQTLRLADLAGKVWVADFIFTMCPGPCETLSSRLSDVQKVVGDEAGVRLVSISVDPGKDTPEVLKTYAARFQAGEHWYFLTGQKDAVYTLVRDAFKLPVADAPPEGGLITHSTRLVLVDKQGIVRGFYEGTTETAVPDLIRDIRRLLDEK